MPQIIVLPHEEFCPEGVVIEVDSGTTVCRALLANDIEIEHACEMACACTTCHVIVREGFDSLEESDETEDDLLDKAWGLEPDSRLSCQVVIGDEDLVIEIPKYTINQVFRNTVVDRKKEADTFTRRPYFLRYIAQPSATTF